MDLAESRAEAHERIARWVLCGLLATAFVAAGGMKLAAVPSMVAEFHDIGLGQWFRYAVGAVEVGGAVGVMLPRLHRLAAGVLGAVMIGALATNVAVLHRPPVVPGLLLTLAAAVVWLRHVRRAWAVGMGVGSLLVGVLRFIPIPSVPDLATPEYFHGCVHLAAGGWFCWAALRADDSDIRLHEAFLGVFFVAFACIGWLGLVKFDDNFVHLGIGVVSIPLAGRSGLARAWSAVRGRATPAPLDPLREGRRP